MTPSGPSTTPDTDPRARVAPTEPVLFDVRTASHSRRQVLVAGGALLAGGGVTAACGASGSKGAGASQASATTSSAPTPTSVTVKTSDVPVGGGEILADQKVVITQPTAGTFKAFTAVCTHLGCVVATVANGVIQCPCHGSQYSIVDGSVQGGPAPAPLAAVPITVEGSTITLS